MVKLKKNLSVLFVLGALVTGCSTNDTTDGSTATSSSSEEQTNVVRETSFGAVEGYNEGEALIWKGVPYGGDTSGENRWKAPTDPEPWEETLDATESGDIAIQFSADGAVGSEDALNLDIYRPDNDAEDLPVLVFIHGGNNQTGRSEEISGKSFAENHDAIVVSVNYRLGPLGFNPLPALKTGTDEENSGNYTMLDIAKSLDWVEENIAAFGGDKENVTISGFSAGGRDVMAMLISPLFEGKFDKAISFSGGMTIADEAESQQRFAEAFAPLVVEDGVKEDEEQAKQWLLSTDTAVADYLYELEADRLVELMNNAGIRMEVFPHLYNDGVVIPEEGFDTENYNSVPIVMLTGAQEFSLFGRFDKYFADANESDEINTNPEISNQYDFINNYGGQLYGLFNVQDSAEKMAANYDAPIYGTEILYGSNAEVVGEEMAKLGAFHGIFVPMLDTENVNYQSIIGDNFETDGAKELTNLFQNYIYQFISTGDPNGTDLPEWKEWTPDSAENMLFLDATEAEASATMGEMGYTYDSVLEAIEADDTITPEQKQALLAEVLNGRWFSAGLDAKFNQ